MTSEGSSSSNRGAPVIFQFTPTHALVGAIGQIGGPSLVSYDGYTLSWPTQVEGDISEPGANLGSLLGFLQKIVRHAYSSVLLLDPSKHKAIICEPAFPFSDPVKRILRLVFTGYEHLPVSSSGRHSRESHGRDVHSRDSHHSRESGRFSREGFSVMRKHGFLNVPGIAFSPTPLCLTLSARSDVALIVHVSPAELTIVPVYDSRVMASHTKFRKAETTVKELFEASPDLHDDDDEVPLHQIIYKLVEGLDIDLQLPLYENVLFSGIHMDGLATETVVKMAELGPKIQVIQPMDLWTATSVFYQSSGNPERLRRVKLIGE